MDDLQSRSMMLMLKLMAISVIAGVIIFVFKAWPEFWPVISIVALYKSVHLILKEVQLMIDESKNDVSV